MTVFADQHPSFESTNKSMSASDVYSYRIRMHLEFYIYVVRIVHSGKLEHKTFC